MTRYRDLYFAGVASAARNSIFIERLGFKTE